MSGVGLLEQSVFPPQAVLHDEDEEEEEAGDEGRDAEAKECTRQVALDVVDARGGWRALLDGAGPVELSGAADASAVVLSLEEVDPLRDGVV